MARLREKVKPREGSVRRALVSRARHGIGELLEEVVEVREIEVARVAPHPRQPRRHVDAAGIEDLARSIERHGLLQPIIVRPLGDAYELVAGSRRLRAVESLGRPRITAIVLQGGDGETLALIENLQRADLDPVDEGEALTALKERQGCTLEELQRLIGRSVSYLSEMMSVSRLPEAVLGEVRARAAEGRAVPRATLVELARIKEPVAQEAAWRQVAAGDGQRAAVRALRHDGREPAGRASPAPAPPSGAGPTAALLTRRLEGVSTLLGRAGTEAPQWRERSVRQALIELRQQIDFLLGDR